MPSGTETNVLLYFHIYISFLPRLTLGYNRFLWGMDEWIHIIFRQIQGVAMLRKDDMTSAEST